jgi:hypothetical protein
MKTNTFFSAEWLARATGLMLLVLAGALPGCSPGKPAVATYQAGVTNASPAQAEEDRQQVASLFAEIAGPCGLVKNARFPANEGTLYFPGSNGLNLALSAIKLDERTLAISIIPVMQGRKDNAACRTVIATADQTLRKNFGARLVQSP